MWWYVYIYKYVYMCVFIYTYAYIHLNMHIYHIFIFKCMYVYIYVRKYFVSGFPCKDWDPVQWLQGQETSAGNPQNPCNINVFFLDPSSGCYFDMCWFSVTATVQTGDCWSRKDVANSVPRVVFVFWMLFRCKFT